MDRTFLLRKRAITTFLSRKRAITTFLSRKFMITRSSIAFEYFLGSSIAPQVMPPCICLQLISGSGQIALPPAFARLEQRGAQQEKGHLHTYILFVINVQCCSNKPLPNSFSTPNSPTPQIFAEICPY